jgi:hypothetical protein
MQLQQQLQQLLQLGAQAGQRLLCLEGGQKRQALVQCSCCCIQCHLRLASPLRPAAAVQPALASSPTP